MGLDWRPYFNVLAVKALTRLRGCAGSSEPSLLAYATSTKGVRALRGYFGPLQSQKLKVAFHQFHLIGLLEE